MQSSFLLMRCDYSRFLWSRAVDLFGCLLGYPLCILYKSPLLILYIFWSWFCSENSKWFNPRECSAPAASCTSHEEDSSDPRCSSEAEHCSCYYCCCCLGALEQRCLNHLMRCWNTLHPNSGMSPGVQTLCVHREFYWKCYSYSK